MNRQEFISAFREYISYISSDVKTISQRKADSLYMRAEDLVPNARLAELHSYSERDRTDQEIIEEALCREDIYEKEGEVALLLYVRAQQVAALANPQIITRHKIHADGNIKEIDAELEKLKSSIQ